MLGEHHCERVDYALQDGSLLPGTTLPVLYKLIGADSLIDSLRIVSMRFRVCRTLPSWSLYPPSGDTLVSFVCCGG